MLRLFGEPMGLILKEMQRSSAVMAVVDVVAGVILRRERNIFCSSRVLSVLFSSLRKVLLRNMRSAFLI